MRVNLREFFLFVFFVFFFNENRRCDLSLEDGSGEGSQHNVYIDKENYLSIIPVTPSYLCSGRASDRQSSHGKS